MNGKPWFWIVSVAIGVPVFAVVIVAALYAAELEQLFSDFGVPLPMLTRFAYDWNLASLLFLLLLVPLASITNGASRGKGARTLSWFVFAVGFVVFLAWITTMAVGLYIPFERLAGVE